MRASLAVIVLAALATAAFACGGSRSPPSTLTVEEPTATRVAFTATATVAATPQLAPADSAFPAAGICLEPPTGDVVTITIYPDIPSPRCAQVRGDQRLSFVNETTESIQVTLADYDLTLAPGETQAIEAPVGAYLAPGVHTAHTSTYGGESGPEVWVLP